MPYRHTNAADGGGGTTGAPEQSIDLNGSYPELGIRSFGKEHLPQAALVWRRCRHQAPVQHPGTRRPVVLNVFAWEGAIAIAQPECGPFLAPTASSPVKPTQMTTAAFLRYYFLTEEGMLKIGEASPGGAGH